MKIEFKKSVSKEWLLKNYDVEEGDIIGSGVYRVWSGSRGLIEEFGKISDSNVFEMKSKDELVEELKVTFDIDEEEFDDYVEEWVGSGKIDWFSGVGYEKSDIEGYYETINEEDIVEFFWVEV